MGCVVWDDSTAESTFVARGGAHSEGWRLRLTNGRWACMGCKGLSGVYSLGSSLVGVYLGSETSSGGGFFSRLFSVKRLFRL